MSTISERDRLLLGRVGVWTFGISIGLLVMLIGGHYLLESAASRRATLHAASRAPVRGGRSSANLADDSGTTLVADVKRRMQTPLLVASAISGLLTLVFRIGVSTARRRIREGCGYVSTRTSETLAVVLMVGGAGLFISGAAWHDRARRDVEFANEIDQRDLESRTFRGRPSPYGGTMTVIQGGPANRARHASDHLNVILPTIQLLLGTGGVLFFVGLVYWEVARRMLQRRAPMKATIGEEKANEQEGAAEGMSTGT